MESNRLESSVGKFVVEEERESDKKRGNVWTTQQTHKNSQKREKNKKN